MREWGIALTLFLVSAQLVDAAFSFSLVSADPSTISDSTTEIRVDLQLNDLPSPSYFRAAFQKESGDNYFGQMKNSAGDWVTIGSLSSPCQDYIYLSDTAATSAAILLRVGDSLPSQPGTYYIKAHRFTVSSCSATSAANSLPVTLSLSLPTATLHPTSTPRPASTPKPTSAKVLPTPIPSLIPSPEPTLFWPSLGITEYPLPTDVLGLATQIQPPALPPSPPVPSPVTPPPWGPMILVALGSAGFLGSVVALILRRP